MTKKKEQKISVTQVDIAQLQALLGQTHQIAQALHSSTNQHEAETTLQPITSTSEAAQIALLKTLSKEGNTDAADVVLALYELSPLKNVRKEARRSQLRLEEAHIYPHWQPPFAHTSVVDQFIHEQEIQTLNTPTRFWKGFITDTLDSGEVQLILLWEQGPAYREVRVLGFLLEFRHEGIEDCFAQMNSKRNAERLLAETEAQVPILDCSLSTARKLILAALAVNKKYGTQPHSGYQRHLALINELVLQAPGISEEEEEEDEEEKSLINLEPEQVVTTFVDAWADGDYDYAYHFLAEQSSLREGLSREEWATRRESWAETADPFNMEPTFAHEREPQKSVLWLPNPFSRQNSTTKKEIEAVWSIELTDTTEPLPELPQTTTIYKETGRHWFWVTYTLIQEQEGWLIQSMTDEATNAMALPVAELRRRIEENNDHVERITREHSPNDPDALQYLLEMVRRTTQNLFYYDALQAQEPHNSDLYLDAMAHAVVFEDIERGIVYAERLVANVPEQKARSLRQLAGLQLQLSEQYDTEDDEESEERSEHLREQAEAALRESLSIEDNALAHLTLAELMIEFGEDDESLLEAETHLHQAQALTSDATQQAMIETNFGLIAEEHDEYEKALSHYQRVVEIQPDYPHGWFNIGQTYSLLEDSEKAIESYKHAINVDPDDLEAYGELVTNYIRSGRVLEARTLLKEGLEREPESAPLLTLLASTYFDSDPRRADELLSQAERIEPDSLLVQLYRQIFETERQKHATSKQTHGKKRKKR